MNKEAKIKPADALKVRVAKVKAVFTEGTDYTPLYQWEFGQQTDEQLEKIRNVWNMRSSDEQITENLEKLARKLKSKNQD